jgi:AcrR family transcriptional regulator
VFVGDLRGGPAPHGGEALVREPQARAFERNVRVGHSGDDTDDTRPPPRIFPRRARRDCTPGAAFVHCATVTTAPVTDGRSVRSQKTRTRVLDALLGLVREGNPRPTAREIAERAGVSLRSVYVHFDDLEDLFIAAAQRQLELVADLYVKVPAKGTLRERANALMDVRSRFYEATTPVRRAAELHAPASKALTTFLRDMHAAGRRDLERVFARELDSFPPDQRRGRVATLAAISGSAAWHEMRTAGRLDVAAARTATVEAIISLLETKR